MRKRKFNILNFNCNYEEESVNHPMLYNLKIMINHSKITAEDMIDYFMKHGLTREKAVERSTNMISSIKFNKNIKLESIEDWCCICNYDIIFKKEEE